MFDLLQRSNLRTEFDEFALQYVVQFERSAPGWDETRPDAAQNNASTGGYVAPAGKLTGSGTQLAGLRRAIDKRVPHARLDLSSVAAFDDEGAHLLADLLAQARRHKVALTIERPEKLIESTDAMVKRGKDGGQGAWQLSLELLQWRHEQTVFDDRAVEFAVTFEVSPPSWDPPPDAAAVAAAAQPEAVERPLQDENGIAFAGSLIGPNVPQISHFTDYAHRRDVVVVDMARVERMDFVCAGAFLNALGRVESQRKSVQIVGASPIVRALLLLIGVSPRNFVKRTG
jgi:anti-anti-sigma regulatory factor